jgi:hypothetical protein
MRLQAHRLCLLATCCRTTRFFHNDYNFLMDTSAAGQSQLVVRSKAQQHSPSLATAVMTLQQLTFVIALQRRKHASA